MLSGVPGLLTFITVSDDVLERTSELPTLVHITVGSGLPDPLQKNVIPLPSTRVPVVLLISAEEGTGKNLRINFLALIYA